MVFKHDISIPIECSEALRILHDSGFEAWVVGGYIRDAIMGREGPDIDIACSAPWEETKRVFEACGHRVRETGAKHGTVTCIVGERTFEITSFRVDGPYSDGRHPDSVSPAASIEEDLARRDFTMNAIAWNPEYGFTDPYGGLADIERETIRSVGDPAQRFREDPLRILRGVRFASQLGFSIDPGTLEGMLAAKDLLGSVSTERITHELDGFVCGAHVHDALMQCVQIVGVAIPEILSLEGFEQHSPYHCYDILEHTAYAMQYGSQERLIRWALLLHDIGKPNAFYMEDGVGHFKGHAKFSAQIADTVLARLLMSHSFREDVVALVREHDSFIPIDARGIKRALARLDGRVDLFRALCEVKRADALAHAPGKRKRAKGADELLAMLEEVLASDTAFSLKDLAIDGRDAIACGIPEGPAVGEALQAALEAVIDEACANTVDDLMAFLTQWKGSREP